MERNLMAGARHPTQVRPRVRPGNNKIDVASVTILRKRERVVERCC